MSALKNAQQVKDLLTNTLAKDPGNYAATVNYVIVDMFQKLEQLAMASARNKKAVDGIIGHLNNSAAQQPAQVNGESAPQPAVGAPPAPQMQLPPGMQMPGTQTGAPPQMPQQPAPQVNLGMRGNGFTGVSPSGAKYVNGVRMGANGEPLSEADQQIEEQFDAAQPG